MVNTLSTDSEFISCFYHKLAFNIFAAFPTSGEVNYNSNLAHEYCTVTTTWDRVESGTSSIFMEPVQKTPD